MHLEYLQITLQITQFFHNHYTKFSNCGYNVGISFSVSINQLLFSSVGGASTHFHILSAESRKYFRNAILMSGAADNYWATSDKNDHLELAHRIAEELGESKKAVDELVEVLKRAPAVKITEHSAVDISKSLLEFSFTPVIECKYICTYTIYQ